jgi:hypothetical protein
MDDIRRLNAPFYLHDYILIPVQELCAALTSSFIWRDGGNDKTNFRPLLRRQHGLRKPAVSLLCSLVLLFTFLCSPLPSWPFKEKVVGPFSFLLRAHGSSIPHSLESSAWLLRLPLRQSNSLELVIRPWYTHSRLPKCDGNLVLNIVLTPPA